MRLGAVPGAREVGGISGDREQVRNTNQVVDLYMEAFCVLVGGEGQTKVAGRRLALSSPRSVGAPGLRAARPWLAAAREAVPTLVLRLCEQRLVSGSPPTHFGSLHRGSPVLTNPGLCGGPGGEAWHSK